MAEDDTYLTSPSELAALARAWAGLPPAVRAAVAALAAAVEPAGGT